MNLREALQDIYDAHRELTPAIVVGAARPRNHPLHDRFEWNNRVAGPKYREVQAKELIRSVKIAYVDPNVEEPMTVRAFVSIPDGAGHRTYVPTETVVLNDLQLAMVLRDMQRRWTDLRATYGHMEQFAEMVRGDLETG